MKYNLSQIMKAAWAHYYSSSRNLYNPFNQQDFTRCLKWAWQNAKSAARQAACEAAREAEKAELVKNGRESIQTELDVLEEEVFSIRMKSRWSRDDENELRLIHNRTRILREALAACPKVQAA